MLRQHKRRFILAILILVLLCTILYKLADRYLIEHVEVIVTPHAATPSAGDTSDRASNSNSTSSSSAAGAQTNNSSVTDTAKWDDWSYEDASQTISIRKVETGSGSDKITYYVADVVFNSTTNLWTAFAKNAFGTNIIANTSEIAASNNAIFAINGDYYGFREDGVVIRNGTVYRDEPAREGLVLYEDGTMDSYDELSVSAESLLASGASNTFSFGPALVKDGQVADDLDRVRIDNNFGNRSIQNANPRTGIGMIAPNHYIFVVVDGRSANYSRGMTLNEFAELFQQLGATEAYNLDGGGSSTMYFMGRVVNNPLGRGKERGVSDIIYIPQASKEAN